MKWQDTADDYGHSRKPGLRCVAQQQAVQRSICEWPAGASAPIESLINGQHACQPNLLSRTICST